MWKQKKKYTQYPSFHKAVLILSQDFFHHTFHVDTIGYHYKIYVCIEP